MNDLCHPTDEDLKVWAYSGALYPCEDWDLMVFDGPIDAQRASLVLDIAMDTACPNREAFLHFLFVMTGSLVRLAARDGIDGARLAVIEPLITKALPFGDEKLRAWAMQSQAAIADPTTFQYEDWF